MVTVGETARYCRVSVNAVYRWMELGLIEWVYNAGGKRRIYKDSLVRPPQEDEAERSGEEPEAARRDEE